MGFPILWLIMRVIFIDPLQTDTVQTAQSIIEWKERTFAVKGIYSTLVDLFFFASRLFNLFLLVKYNTTVTVGTTIKLKINY